MEAILIIFILIPLLGFALSLILPAHKESLISKNVFATVAIQLLGLVALTIFWMLHQHPIINHKDIVVYQNQDYAFYIDFLFDKTTAFFLLIGAYLTLLITVYCRYYLHREEGYKRFFNAILLFFLGFNITVLAGNFETLFIGWEILGISSFLLITFYRDRYLPVKNAMKIFTVYRISDLGLIIAMWLSHHFWQHNITFLELRNLDILDHQLNNHPYVGLVIALMILLTAIAKSAQFPFSFWLPRAMEGPTPSSAIFYGALSVHMGVFLLMRTAPFWDHLISVKILIGLIGLITAIISTGISRVQSSIKSQIAYSSIAQIGLIFIELAFGLYWLALIHVAGNAFLRAYQLLVSPSVASYLIREQFYNFIPSEYISKNTVFRKLQFSVYLLCIKEWNLDHYMYKFFWSPIKKISKRLNILSPIQASFVFGTIYLLGLMSLFFEEQIPDYVHSFLPACFAFLGLLMILKSFVERQNPFLAWGLIIMNHLWIALAVSFNEAFNPFETWIYLSGILIAGFMGWAVIHMLRKSEGEVNLNRFWGHSFEHPNLTVLFLLASLGLSGFPISPTFVGEDLIFSHIHEGQLALVFFVSCSYVLDGISIMRIFSRLFLGPHIKQYHEVAYRSS